MYFDNYKDHSEAVIRKSLLWEYDTDDLDWDAMRDIVVQRVVERGLIDDYYAMLNMYGIEGVKESIKRIPTLSPKDTSFVVKVFDIDKKQLKCCTRKRSRQQHGSF